MADVTFVESASDEHIAGWLHGRLARALGATDGVVAIAVPGGSTPFPILAQLAGMRLDWDRIVVWPGDDREVPEDHPASNVGKIRALLQPAGARVAPLDGGEPPPHFSLVWLGMGGDGHIASLFPSADPQADDPQRVRWLTPDPLPAEAPFPRVTLTIPALLDCDEIVFVIRGADKRAVFEAALKGENDLPVARLLGAARQAVTCFT